MATRHLIRSVILQSLYEWDFYNHAPSLPDILERNMQEFAPGVDEPEFAWRILERIVKNLATIDALIVKVAPEWPIERIANIDRNILRIGLSELLYADPEEVPARVAMNEAIELAKGYGGPNAARFINGVLGTVYRDVIAPAEAAKTGQAEPAKEPPRKKEEK